MKISYSGRLFPAAAVAALLAVSICSFSGTVPAQERLEPDRTLGVVYADGRLTEDIPLYELESPSKELFISAYDLARVFRASRYWNPGARKLILRIDGRRFMFTLDTRLVLVGDEPVLLRVPVRYRSGMVMVPIEFVSQVLAPNIMERIEMDEERLVLTIGSPDYNVTGIAFEGDESGTRAVLTLTEELLYHVDSDTPGLLRLKIYGGKLNALKFSASAAEGLFNRVRAEQTEHDAYLFFDVMRSASRFRVEFFTGQEDGRRQKQLVIYLEKGEMPEIPDADFAGRRMTEIIDESTAGKRLDLRKIAIDPGHGGVDRGKTSDSGIEEKNVNLEIAMLLKNRILEEFGVDVVMTRTEDVLVPLSRRAEIANSEGADLFISMHCNGWFHPDAGGFETFFLSPARTEEDMRLASEENASIMFENPELKPEELEDLDFILWDMVQNEFINESSDFAEAIQKELGGRLSIRNRGVKQAGLLVLKGLRMPAVLVEVAFLSNPEEEELLIDPLFRARVVQGIVEAIRKYQEKRTGNGVGR